MENVNYKGIELNMTKAMAERIIKDCQIENFTERRLVNKLKKESDKITKILEGKDVKSINIEIEWKKTSYGWCPRAEAKVIYLDNSCDYMEGYKASGYGYDKESTVVANILNDVLRKKIMLLKNTDKIPYGIRVTEGFLPYFEGGVGMSCYNDIIEFLGGKIKHIVNNKRFDAYRIEF